ncbi:MAG: hypothetical protein WA945_04680, partial [Arcobacteraceae bacterium]
MFFKTLKKEINNHLKDTIYKNEYYINNKYETLEKIIIEWSANPFVQSLLFTLYFSILSIILYSLKDIHYLSASSSHWDKVANFTDIIYGSQLTLIAIIFPLVIGFVGVLIKDDTANKSLWRIYSRYSGFQLVGYSSLLLIFSMTFI